MQPDANVRPLRSLIGQEVSSVTGRSNRVLFVDFTVNDSLTSSLFAASHGPGRCDQRVTTTVRRSLSLGEGSSKPGTKRYGKPFTRTQVQHRIGEALLTALAVASRDSAQAAIAVPDIRLYHSVADPVLPALHRLGIIVFWVGEDRTLKEYR